MVEYAKTHIFYIALIAVLVVFGRVWLSEHDARVASDNAAKAAQVKVADLQKQIDVIPAQTAEKVKIITQVVHDAVTPSQVVASLPAVDKNLAVDLSARVAPDNPVAVEVNAQPLMVLVGELKTSQAQLDGCQQTVSLKDQQLSAKDTEIVALKKKPKFFTRVKHVAEAVGIGVGIGFVLAAKL